MSKFSTKKLVLASILTALVIILQFLGSFIRLGPFSVSAVLVPIVIGAATCGIGIGAWLGFVFGIVVLLSGDAAAFLAVDIPGTIITVLLKGTLCGFFAGVFYRYILSCMDKLSAAKVKALNANGSLCDSCTAPMLKYFSSKNQFVAVAAAAVICPIVNTGIFLLGCLVFFMDTISGWALAAELGGNVAQYMIFVLVGANFLVEMGINIVLSPVIVRLLNIKQK